jgi:hypothetical protein
VLAPPDAFVDSPAVAVAPDVPFDVAPPALSAVLVGVSPPAQLNWIAASASEVEKCRSA